MINYSLIYTNSQKEAETYVDKYVCVDNKIHVRFKDFNKEEYLIGFEKKLTYLLSYLLKYSYMRKLVGNYNNKEILTGFLLYDDVLQIIELIKRRLITAADFKGLLVKPNYKRQQLNYEYFGDTDIKFFPLQIKNNLVETGNLEFFLETFDIQLYTYLFNDDYVIWLHDKEFKVTKKFENRKLKKENKQANKNVNIVELW